MLAIDQLQVWDALEGKTFLVCVGAAKCATSWLYAYLDNHPAAAVSPLKELHFFNARFPRNSLVDADALALARLAYHLNQPGDPVENLHQRPAFRASLDRAQMLYDDNAYFAHFARLCSDTTETLCDLTPAYSALEEAGFLYLRRFFASQRIALKILFVMRDPVERFWSQLRHLQQMKPENDILRLWPEALRSKTLNARADYRETVSNLDTIFDADQVLYLFYEELFSSESVRRLSEFAGLEPLPFDLETRFNETTVKLAMPPDAAQALGERLGPQYAFCRKRFGKAVPASWRQ